MPEREVPEIWWSPLGGGLMVKVQSGRMRFLELTEHDSVALPEDAVRLVPEPSEQTYERVTGPTGVTIRRTVGQWETVTEASDG